MKKNIFLILIACIMAIVTGIFAFRAVSSYLTVESKVERDIEKKYGEKMELRVIDTYDTCEMFVKGYVLEVVGNPEMHFHVTIEEGWILPDKVKNNEYEAGKKAYEEYKKMEKKIPDIEKLGFTKDSEMKMIESGGEDAPATLNLKAENMDASELSEKDYNAIFELTQILKVEDVKIGSILFSEVKNADYKLRMEMRVFNSVEEVEHQLKLDNEFIVEFEEGKKMKKVLDNVPNKKFAYIKQEGKDYPKITCPYEEEGVYCPNMQYEFTYVKGGLDINKNDQPLLEMLELINYLNEHTKEEYSIRIKEDRTERELFIIIEDARKYKDIDTLRKDLLENREWLREYNYEK